MDLRQISTAQQLRRMASAVPEPEVRVSMDALVVNDGRCHINFHENTRTLHNWLRTYEADFCEHAKHRSRAKQSKTRRQSSITPFVEPKASSPRLNIVILIIGSRGDVQPFIPIAQLLMRPPYGHRVRICTHPVFQEFVESSGIEFFNIGGDPEALMAYMVKNPGLLPNMQSFKAGDIRRRRNEMDEIIHRAWRGCIEAGDGTGDVQKAAWIPDPADLFVADAIIANPPSMAHIHCAEKLGVPLHLVFTMPWSPTRTFHHPLAAMEYEKSDPSVANYLSFMVMELMTWQGLGDIINKFRQNTLQLDPISPMWGYQLIPRLRVPYSYLWSQSLIPRPPDWNSHIDITGFSFLPLGDKYEPPPDLVRFLNSGPPPIYIGFGSIVVDDPSALTRLVVEAVNLAGVRVILSKGWGGMAIEDETDHIYLIGNCPHDWLFQRVSAVVHHGGAGTTAAGIAAGRPTVVVPFFGDQLFWGQMVSGAGAGPEPIRYAKLTAESLAESILFALRSETQDAVQKMAQQIATEDGAGDTAQNIQDRLGVDDLRCEICPERLAHWKHRKTGARLSGFAVACLVDQAIIEPREVKILLHKHWYVDEGAEHPLIGAVAAVTGFASAVANATSRYSARLRRNQPPRPSRPLDSDAPLRRPGDATPVRDIPQDATNGVLGHVLRGETLSPGELELLAKKMTLKSVRKPGPEWLREENRANSAKLNKSKRGKRSSRQERMHGIMKATGKYTADVTIAGLKAPVAFFYNVANGFHNYPSYAIGGREVRRRDEITGFGSGALTAGKEFGLGFWDAFRGLAEKPYLGAKDEGGKGFAKGVWAGGRDFLFNTGAATFGILGYPLKGLEKELSKRHMTKLKAEILLVRLRQAMAEFIKASPEERSQIGKRWKDANLKKRTVSRR